MGFYNIYKILKDMIRTLFGKHFLKILIVAILIFTIFFVYNECFATIPTDFSSNFVYNGLTFHPSNNQVSSSFNSGVNRPPFTRSNGQTNYP